jgi:hypothetical protein
LLSAWVVGVIVAAATEDKFLSVLRRTDRHYNEKGISLQSRICTITDAFLKDPNLFEILTILFTVTNETGDQHQLRRRADTTTITITIGDRIED